MDGGTSDNLLNQSLEEYRLPEMTTLPDGWNLSQLNDGSQGAVWSEDVNLWDTFLQTVEPALSPVLPEVVSTNPLTLRLSKPAARPLSCAEARNSLLPLVRLAIALEKKGLIIVEIPLDCFGDGPNLRLLPRIVRVGSRVELPGKLLAPELHSGEPAEAQASSFALAAAFYGLVMNSPLPHGGLPRKLPEVLHIPGIPQLLNQALAARLWRPTLTTFLDRLQNLECLEPQKLQLEVGVASTIGLNPHRFVNEDAVGYVKREIHTEGKQLTLLRAIVCDGIGGMEAGEVAATTAVHSFLEHDADFIAKDNDDLADAALRLAHNANAAVLEVLSGRKGGCTLIAALIQDSRFAIAHLGDSRAYLHSQGQLIPLSRDHSLVAAMVAGGAMTPAEASISPLRNQLLRSIGLEGNAMSEPDGLEVTIGTRTLELEPGDALVLMTDGIWSDVSEVKLLEALTRYPEASRAAAAIRDATLAAGANDNATVLIVRRSA